MTAFSVTPSQYRRRRKNQNTANRIVNPKAAPSAPPSMGPILDLWGLVASV
jgi:hypothetical protein